MRQLVVDDKRHFSNDGGHTQRRSFAGAPVFIASFYGNNVRASP
jgi:hypothetical protein